MSSAGHPQPAPFPLVGEGDSSEQGGGRKGGGQARGIGRPLLPGTCSLRTQVGREGQSLSDLVPNGGGSGRTPLWAARKLEPPPRGERGSP